MDGQKDGEEMGGKERTGTGRILLYLYRACHSFLTCLARTHIDTYLCYMRA